MTSHKEKTKYHRKAGPLELNAWLFTVTSESQEGMDGGCPPH